MKQLISTEYFFFSASKVVIISAAKTATKGNKSKFFHLEGRNVMEKKKMANNDTIQQNANYGLSKNCYNLI